MDEFDEISEDDDDEDYSDDDVGEEEEEEPVVAMDYNAMKLTELRELAKSTKVKRFSKLKKSEFVELLSGV